MPQGTVYGTLLNFQGEGRPGARWTSRPTRRRPRRRCCTSSRPTPGARTAPPFPCRHVPAGRSGRHHRHGDGLGRNTVAGYVLMNDLSVPHASFFRPPVKFKCLDGFLGIGAGRCRRPKRATPRSFKLEVRINGELKQTLDFASWCARRAAAGRRERIHDAAPGDVLMLGCDVLPGRRPLAAAGDRIDISAPGFATLTNTWWRRPSMKHARVTHQGARCTTPPSATASCCWPTATGVTRRRDLAAARCSPRPGRAPSWPWA
jgi:5-oxopent-3-ene-1,2,5-tricarboxylate decarboxylase/2-hydroxyhepta-2,4-diene-1,7-dioate isomerase